MEQLHPLTYASQASPQISQSYDIQQTIFGPCNAIARWDKTRFLKNSPRTLGKRFYTAYTERTETNLPYFPLSGPLWNQVCSLRTYSTSPRWRINGTSASLQSIINPARVLLSDYRSRGNALISVSRAHCWKSYITGLYPSRALFVSRIWSNQPGTNSVGAIHP